MLHDVDDERTALAIRAGLERYGQYHETIGLDDLERTAQLRRVGQAVADALGLEVGIAGVPTVDGMVRICVMVVRAAATPEHV